MFQKVIVAGNLGTDPELRSLPSGKSVCTFSLATNRRYTPPDGEAREETTWFRVTTWGRTAEVCSQYLAKGRQVLCEGRLTVDPETGGPRIWTDQNGNPRASFELSAMEVRFIGGRGEGGGGGGAGASYTPRQQPAQAADGGNYQQPAQPQQQAQPVVEDDMPF